MKRKNLYINLGIVFLILLIALISISGSGEEEIDENLVSCIANNSILYSQLGCSHCRTQENLFGDQYEKLNVVDCFYNAELCVGIMGTPSWKIKNETYSGVHSIEELKLLTGC